MGTSWAKNLYAAPFIGPLTEEELNDIPYPELELGIHITYKTVQAGSLFGCVAAGAHKLFGGRKLTAAAAAATRRAYLRRGVYFGLLVGPAMTYARIYNQTPESIYDRSYRLRHNRGQLLTDQITSITSLSGFVLGGLSGVALGSTAGLAAVAGYNAYNKQQAAEAAGPDSKSSSKPKADGDDKKNGDAKSVFDQVVQQSRAQQEKLTEKLQAAKHDVEDKVSHVKHDVEEKVSHVRHGIEDVAKAEAEQLSHSPWLFDGRWSANTADLASADLNVHEEGKCPWVDGKAPPGGGDQKQKQPTDGKCACNICRLRAPVAPRSADCRCGCHQDQQQQQQ